MPSRSRSRSPEPAPVPEPGPEPEPTFEPVSWSQHQSLTELPVEPEPEPEPYVEPAVSTVMDILPDRPAGRSRRMPRIRSRAMKPPAPLPTRSAVPPTPPAPPVSAAPVAPAAYQQAPVAPPVGPSPVDPVPAAAAFSAPPATDDQPDFRGGTIPAGHFAAPVAEEPAAPQFGAPLFGTPAAPEPPQSGLPQREPVAAAATRPGGADFETMQLRERSAIASEALSELSALSGYRPQAVENRGQATMPRRTPQATPGLEPAPPAAPVPHRERNATDVRSMLSGFRAGVERGRADKSPESDS